MTVQSEIPTDILIQDFVMTNRKDITHNNTVEGIMYEWNRVVLHSSTLQIKYIEGYIKVVLETDILSLGNLVFKYLHLFPCRHNLRLDNQTVLSRVVHSGKGVDSPSE